MNLNNVIHSLYQDGIMIELGMNEHHYPKVLDLKLDTVTDYILVSLGRAVECVFCCFGYICIILGRHISKDK